MKRISGIMINGVELHSWPDEIYEPEILDSVESVGCDRNGLTEYRCFHPKVMSFLENLRVWKENSGRKRARRKIIRGPVTFDIGFLSVTSFFEMKDVDEDRSPWEKVRVAVFIANPFSPKFAGFSACLWSPGGIETEDGFAWVLEDAVVLYQREIESALSRVEGDFFERFCSGEKRHLFTVDGNVMPPF